MRGVTIKGSRRYDGEHELALALMKPSDYGLIKRLTGYLPADVPDGIGGYDLELICAIAVVALRSNGRISAEDGEAEARLAYAELIDIVGGSVRLDLGTDDEAEGDDAVPPSESSTSNGGTPGPDSRTSSETSQTLLEHGGTRGSATSGLRQVRSAT